MPHSTLASNPGLLAPGPFEDKVDAWLAQLQARLGFRFWALLRWRSGAMRILRCIDGYGGVKPGACLRWPELRVGFPDQALMFFPSCGQQAAAIVAADHTALPVRAMILLQLFDAQGQLCGALCALDPSEKPDSIRLQEALLRFAGAQLTGLLFRAISQADEQRARERAALSLSLDPVSGLFSNVAWTRALQTEEVHRQRLGGEAGIVALKLRTGNGEVPDPSRLIRRSGWILRCFAEPPHLTARLGEDSFAVLVLGDAARFAERLRTAFAVEGIPIRIASAQDGDGLDDLATTAIAALRAVV